MMRRSDFPKKTTLRWLADRACKMRPPRALIEATRKSDL